MSTYAIDDEHGNRITGGLQEHEARKTAQRIANKREATVYLYEDTEDGDDPEAIEPETTT